MIKAIIFDMDGVLVDARELHYEALNRSLASIDKKYIIGRSEHLSTYDGLPTKKKLQLLTKNKELPEEFYDEIWKKKQKYTIDIIDQEFTYDERMRDILRKLKDENYKIAVCSNSIRETTKMMLIRKGLMEFCEFFISNQDVINSKPNPEMYLKAMINFGLGPKECLIVEDSHIGRQAAYESGSNLCAVENTEDVTLEKIRISLEKYNEKNMNQKSLPKWKSSNLRIIIPMAGEGKRFREMGYSFPKPLIDIKGKPMIQWITENINAEVKHIFIVNEDDYRKYNLNYLLKLLVVDSEIVVIDKPTKGAALTVLHAEQYFNDNDPIAIVNSDQFMIWNSNEFFYAMAADQCAGGIVTFESIHPKWSYVKTSAEGFIIETAEKKPISNMATAGVYYFSKGSDFIKYTNQMIEKNINTNGEYFVCPVYNEMITDGRKIRAFPIDKMWSFSTPEDVEHFIALNK